ncbi:MAG: hypothetical protein Q8O57_09250, partial [Kiritimatiellota bacterium]|nr:hypothetical protein [Kiritimatiellota bacterium]
MNNRHKKSSSAYLMVGVLAWLTTSASLWAADGPPEIGASSIRAEGPTLLYGDNLAGEVMQWTYSEPARPPRAQADEFTRDEELFREIRASLERVLAGKAQPLPAPDEKARWQKLESRDRYTCVANVGHGAHPRVIYLKNQHGISKPYVLNRPEIWGMNPAKAMPGEAVTGWGVNLGMQYALVDKAGKIVDVIQAFQGYNTHSGRYQRELANLLVLPDKLSPGEYSLYNHNGLNDAGWSKAAALLVVERPKS